MIHGVGIDTEEVARFRDEAGPIRQRLMHRLFTKAEWEYAHSKLDPAAHLAVRFAAKEALAKALGKGIAGGISFLDVEVLRDENGKPTLRLGGPARLAADQLGVTQIHVSLSHSPVTAVAIVILESGGTP